MNETERKAKQKAPEPSEKVGTWLYFSDCGAGEVYATDSESFDHFKTVREFLAAQK